MHYKKRTVFAAVIGAGVLLSTAACAGSGTTAGGSADGYSVALSMSYSGNDWQGEAKNLVLAAAKSDTLKDKVAKVDTFVSGTDAQAQISQIQQMIAKQYDAIIIYPISPTALNNVIKQGCDAGIQMFTYDASVTEPCAHNVTFDQKEAGKVTAEYLSDLMGNTGNVVLITGVAGTSVDEDRTSAAKAVFEKRGITVLDSCAGDWAQGPAGECMSRFLAAFDNIDGVWAQVGGVAVPDAFDAAGRPYVPMIAEAENLYRLRLQDPAYLDKGLKGGSYGSPPYQGAAALAMAVQALDGKDFPSTIDIGFDWVPQEDLKMCTTGSIEDLQAGCNTYPEGDVSAGFFADWYSDEWTPGIDLQTLLSIKE
ncbi:substrate-binding domain-containing protein [Microbacteriaceae bacterium VKM Ac-2855]|nr:substrate-binding domain-containing protein [Microbacteriaceae bacterium VKM Ac-2855]